MDEGIGEQLEKDKIDLLDDSELEWAHTAVYDRIQSFLQLILTPCYIKERALI